MTAEAASDQAAIVCPPWCRVDPADHRADLEGWEGRVIHHGEDVGDWSLVSTTWPDGSPDPEPDDLPVMLMDGDQPVTPAMAEQYARSILELVSTARGGTR